MDYQKSLGKIYKLHVSYKIVILWVYIHGFYGLSMQISFFQKNFKFIRSVGLKH